MKDNPTIQSLAELHTKIDLILAELGSIKTQLFAKATKRTSKPKPTPLTEEEINSHKQKFSDLFLLWQSGKELEVQEALDSYDPDLLRRFADANNLNVTARMPKQRILTLIAARFREKRLLLR